MFEISYKGRVSTDLGLRVEKRPAFPAPERNVEYKDIPGRSGSLVIDNGTYKDIEVDIKFNFVNEDETAISRVFRDAKAWLLSGGSGSLTVSDDTDVYYKVKNVSIGDSDRTARIGHSFTATFRLDPYTYYKSGETPISLPAMLYNAHEAAEPVYSITGEGVCTITTTSGTVTAQVGQNLTIDTANMISYRTDSGVRNNIAITGDLEDLKIPAGMFSISLSSGFTGSIVPRWRAL